MDRDSEEGPVPHDGSESGGTREDVEATLASRKELGPEYDRALIESFTQRMDQHVRAQSRTRVSHLRREAAAAHERSRESVSVTLGSLGIGVPLSGVAASNGGLWGLAICWAGILGVNVVHAWSRHFRPGP